MNASSVRLRSLEFRNGQVGLSLLQRHVRFKFYWLFVVYGGGGPVCAHLVRSPL